MWHIYALFLSRPPQKIKNPKMLLVEFCLFVGILIYNPGDVSINFAVDAVNIGESRFYNRIYKSITAS